MTSLAVIPPALRSRARIVAKAPGILAGGPVAVWTFHSLDPSLRCVLKRREGALLTASQTILTIEGRARSIFAAERTALNILSHLSGIATQTHKMIRRARGSGVKIYDTRKTLPGLRALDKYAVRVGGGYNHRMGLHDAILIKTNHLRALEKHAGGGERRGARGASLARAIERAKRIRPRRGVEIEVTSFQELRAALQAGPDAIVLDNWSRADIRQAVLLRKSSSLAARRPPLLEVSGGITLANVRAIARTGVDRLSIGWLTHSAPALDVALGITK
jgi:nicotinate-nucleotide pyrophosphorylase (carboxylating)